MKAVLMALCLVLAIAANAAAQCNAQPRLDQTNLNLGQLLSAPAPAAASSAASAANQAMAAPPAAHGVDPALVAAIVQALNAQNGGGYKRLAMNGSGAASAAASAGGGGYYYEPAPAAPAPSPVQPLGVPVVQAVPVAFALPANSATASAASASNGSQACNSCGGRRGFFRANRTRTRAVSNVNGQRSVATSTSVSR